MSARRGFTRLVLGVVLVGCTPTHPQSAAPQLAPVDPVGRYEFTMVDDGKPGAGTMTVTGSPGSYTGQIKTDTRPTVTISMLATSGPIMIVTADVPQGVLVVRMRFTGDSVAGNWALRSSGGKLNGRRVSAVP